MHVSFIKGAKALLFSLTVLVLSSLTAAQAQVGIGVATAHPSAQLDVTSTTKGFLPPRLTNTQKIAIASPAASLIVWCSDCGTSGELQVYNGTKWIGMDKTVFKNTYVRLTGTDSIRGSKVFMSDLLISGATVGHGRNNIYSNTAVGDSALFANTSGNNNTAIGRLALQSNTTGIFNTATGLNALFRNTSGTLNTANGTNTLANNTTGQRNTAMGHGALNLNKTGNFKTGVGVYSLWLDSTGSNNTAIGDSALYNTTSGNNNSALGYLARTKNDNFSNASAIGAGAIATASNTIQLGNSSIDSVVTAGKLKLGSVIYPNTDGTANQVLSTDGSGNVSWSSPTSITNLVPYTGATQSVDLGAYDLTVNSVTVGLGGGNVSSNTANGYQSLHSNTVGSGNTANGYLSLYSNTTGTGNTANGNYAFYSNTTGTNNTATGANALSSNTTGDQNVANGNNALFSNTDGSGNTALGYSADVASGSLTNATAIGANAIVNASNTIQLGDANVTSVITSGALTLGNVTYPNTDGLADQVLSTDGSGNVTWTTPTSSGVPYSGATQSVNLGGYDLLVNGVIVGIGSGNQNTNTAIGHGVLPSNTTGAYNTANGNYSLYYNNNGYHNSAFGNYSLFSNTTGTYNTANGSMALFSNSTGSSNTANGYQSLYTNSAGSSNTAFGYQSLYNSTGNNNTAFGFNTFSTNTTGYNNTAIGSGADVGSNNLNNATAIGFNARVSASNTIQLGNTSVTRVNTSGTVFVGGTQLTSDKRLKTNIGVIQNGLGTVMQLNPVHYNKKNSIEATSYSKTENGFIAQEIQKVLPFIVQEGIDKDKLLSVDYNSIIPILTKAIQEQQSFIEKLQKHDTTLQQEVDELKALVKKLADKK